METQTYLVTGALGCIGAWTVRNLVRAKSPVIIFDLNANFKRLRLVMSDEEIAQAKFVQGDITDFAQVERVVANNGVNRIVHLAGLQVPFCRADPVLGAQVNVVGTVNIFEAAKRHPDLVQRIVFASSAAVFDVDDATPGQPLPNDASAHPATLYGVYKLANEGTARVYAKENGVTSIGLRPYIVYGPGRDQGMTSAPTAAMLAAAAGEGYHISYGGRADYEYADDTAKAFLQCSTIPFQGFDSFHLPGAVFGMAEVIRAIEEAAPAVRGKVTFDDKQLPFPEAMDGGPLDALLRPLGGVCRTPLQTAVADTIALFRTALADGRVTR